MDGMVLDILANSTLADDTDRLAQMAAMEGRRSGHTGYGHRCAMVVYGIQNDHHSRFANLPFDHNRPSHHNAACAAVASTVVGSHTLRCASGYYPSYGSGTHSRDGECRSYCGMLTRQLAANVFCAHYRRGRSVHTGYRNEYSLADLIALQTCGLSTDQIV